MAESEWLLVGIIIGLIVGVLAGHFLSQVLKPEVPASVVFERDEEGRITGIHYVPGVFRR